MIRRPDREALTTRGGSGGQRSASSRVACAAARGQAYGVNHCFIGNSARLYTKHGPNLSVRHRTRRGRSSQRRSACPNPHAASEAAGGSWQQLTQRRRDSGGRVDACADICRAARRAAHRCSRGGVTRLGSGCRRPAGGGGAPARRSCGAGAAATASARADGRRHGARVARGRRRGQPSQPPASRSVVFMWKQGFCSGRRRTGRPKSELGCSVCDILTKFRAGRAPEAPEACAEAARAAARTALFGLGCLQRPPAAAALHVWQLTCSGAALTPRSAPTFLAREGGAAPRPDLPFHERSSAMAFAVATCLPAVRVSSAAPRTRARAAAVVVRAEASKSETSRAAPASRTLEVRADAGRRSRRCTHSAGFCGGRGATSGARLSPMTG